MILSMFKFYGHLNIPNFIQKNYTFFPHLPQHFSLATGPSYKFHYALSQLCQCGEVETPHHTYNHCTPTEALHFIYTPSHPISLAKSWLQGVVSRSVLLAKLKNISKYPMDYFHPNHLAVCHSVVQQYVESAQHLPKHSISPAANRQGASAQQESQETS